ncbi:MAG: ATP synthase F1 subunit gamma [Clostridia bacterium]|nr:ATP synthase F1 subunit gamma [Clostridia bacterium]
MQSIKDIKGRIKSVSETAQITRAMELISASKMQKASVRYNNSREYFDRIRPIVLDIVNNTTFDEPVRYLSVRPGKKAYLVIGSDRGLSGDYNHSIVSFVAEHTDPDAAFLCVGAAIYTAVRSIRTDVTLAECSSEGKLEDARLLAADLMCAFDEGRYTEISVVYTSMVSKSRQSCRSLQLLPIVPEETTDEKKNFEFAPDPKSALESLVPQYVIGLLYGCITAGKYTEHLERMRAMNAATENANALLDELQLNYNKARQEKITTELTELSSGLIDND